MTSETRTPMAFVGRDTPRRKTQVRPAIWPMHRVSRCFHPPVKEPIELSDAVRRDQPMALVGLSGGSLAKLGLALSAALRGASLRPELRHILQSVLPKIQA